MAALPEPEALATVVWEIVVLAETATCSPLTPPATVFSGVKAPGVAWASTVTLLAVLAWAPEAPGAGAPGAEVAAPAGEPGWCCSPPLVGVALVTVM